uniref:Uncharacterized protein n=1 Tax=Anguilla anguilla TaxID=7936 RepID=A0A0E9XDD9_ANGAN
MCTTDLLSKGKDCSQHY